jgi:tRNA pseudouridine38-40 synthase
MNYRFAAILYYDGTDYCGWQIQNHKGNAALVGTKPSIQESFVLGLKKITGEIVDTTASGRTDAGVHASGQVVHFDLSKKWDSKTLVRALGAHGILPPSIRVLRVVRVKKRFDASRSAIKKQYSYYFQLGPCELSALSRSSWWLKGEVDFQKMKRSLVPIIGEHDFKPFQGAGASTKTSIRRIYEADLKDVTEEALFLPIKMNGFRVLKLTLVGSGFLKQMVRSIAGTLAEIGKDRFDEDHFQKILSKQRRDFVGTTAPARGLWLERVFYQKPGMTR